MPNRAFARVSMRVSVPSPRDACRPRWRGRLRPAMALRHGPEVWDRIDDVHLGQMVQACAQTCVQSCGGHSIRTGGELLTQAVVLRALTCVRTCVPTCVWICAWTCARTCVWTCARTCVWSRLCQLDGTCLQRPMSMRMPAHTSVRMPACMCRHMPKVDNVTTLSSVSPCTQTSVQKQA